MKKSILILFLLPFSICVSAQIKNPGFELLRDTLKTQPQSWNYKKTDGFVFSLDNKVRYTGNTSLRISNNGKANPGTFAPFSQLVAINVTHLKKITLSAYIKTDSVSGSAGLWCQVWDKNKKTIGFESLQTQNVVVNGTRNWAQYSVTLVVDSNAKQLLAGGFLMGSGAVWYDDFSVGDMPGRNDPPSKEVKKFIEEFTDIIKQNAIYKDSLNWAAMQPDIDKLSKGLKTVNEAAVVTAYIMGKLRAAGDHHSFIQTRISAEGYAKSDLDPARPYAKLLNGKIGYINVPGFASINDTAGVHFATAIQQLIHGLDSANVINGWIVDLRNNSGGNMWPMIAGLGPLIGNGTLGYFVNARYENKWVYKNGNDGSVSVKNPYTVKSPGTKIAVLIGPGTVSSGEATVISFIGKPNVKLLGQPTGGYTTANNGFKLSNGAYLYLATSYEADRNKKKYLGKISPDILVDKPAKDNNDPAIDAATNWIMGK